MAAAICTVVAAVLVSIRSQPGDDARGHERQGWLLGVAIGGGRVLREQGRSVHVNEWKVKGTCA